jgi:regulatory protein RepA
MESDHYLLLIPQGNVKSLYDRFIKLGGFFNGVGYAFPLKSESLLEELIRNIPRTKIHKVCLAPWKSFSHFQQSHKAYWFKDLLHHLDTQILSFQSRYNLEYISEKTLISSNLLEDQKREAFDLLREREKLKSSLEWAIGIEKTLSEENRSDLVLEFINEKKVNYLLDEPKSMSRLINYLDGIIPKPFIRKGITAMLVGAGGTGKTHALTQLGLSIATGHPWLNIYPVEKAGYVFLGLGENSEDDIHRLVRKTVKSMLQREAETNHSFFDLDPLKAAGDRIVVKSFTGINASFIHRGQQTDFYSRLLDRLKAKEPIDGWSCIILDPISRFLGSDAENDNAAATQFVALLEKMTLELKGNPTVIFGHHMNKLGITGGGTTQASARGSSALTDGVRWQANLEKLKEEGGHELNEISMRLVKSNFTSTIPPQKLQKDKDGCLSALEQKGSIDSKNKKQKSGNRHQNPLFKHDEL